MEAPLLHLDDPHHHEAQAALHLAAVDNMGSEDAVGSVALGQMRATMAVAHAQLAVSIRFGKAQGHDGALQVDA